MFQKKNLKRKIHKVFYGFFKSKTGDWTLVNAIVMVLAALLVLGIFGFFNRAQGALLSQKDDGSIANFERLYSEIKELIESSAVLDYGKTNYLIGDGKILVGYDTNWNENKDIIMRYKVKGYKLYKPFQCGNAACLCLYTADWKPGDQSKRDDGVISCRSETFANKNVVFLSEGGNVIPTTAGLKRDDNGYYLVFYGDEWKTQQTYIEKYFDGSKTYIYISKINVNDPKDPANIRKTKIEDSKKFAEAP